MTFCSHEIALYFSVQGPILASSLSSAAKDMGPSLTTAGFGSLEVVPRPKRPWPAVSLGSSQDIRNVRRIRLRAYLSASCIMTGLTLPVILLPICQLSSTFNHYPRGFPRDI
ncbi:uncharacterized protein BDV17DRAFT_181672 [Aspergillus undulatus]|uniref:uncharacterized protein n=1 Tax=Aspergillus undulatus TaxID=1810928 RepID=UPI003CCDED3F